MSTTLQELRERTKLLLNESNNTQAGELPSGAGGAPVIYSDTAIDSWINEGLQQLARVSTPINGIGALYTQVGNPYYGIKDFVVGDGQVLTGQLWAIRSVAWGGNNLRYMDRSTLEGYYPDFETASVGTPRLWSGGDDSGVQIFPPPMGTPSLVASGFIQPNELVGNDDPVLYIADTLADNLIPRYAATQFAKKNMDDPELFPRARIWADEWNAEIMRLWNLLPPAYRAAHYRTPPPLISMEKKGG